MKEFFEKHEVLISMLLIVIYIIANSFCMQNFGVTNYRTTIINFVLVLMIAIFIISNKLGKYYGLTSFPKPKEFLYFIPLLMIMSVNLWNGININNSKTEIIFHILSMFCVGFLEEIIFRGFLFKMIEKDNVNRAIVVTSLTFGIGHIINLLNGAELVPTLIQICHAISVGFLFAIILQKGKSLWPCIIAHIAINALSIFNIDNTLSLYIEPIFLFVISILYSIYLRRSKNEKIVFATSNPTKAKRFSKGLLKKGIEILSLKDLEIKLEEEENGKTAIENALIKARECYKKTNMPSIGMDDTLYLENVPEEMQPGLFVRRLNGKTLDDDEMISHYTKLVKKFGTDGKLSCKWIYGLAVISKEGKESTYTWEKGGFYMVDTPSGKINPGYPLNSISKYKLLDKYFTDEITEEERNLLKISEDHIVDFIKEHI